MFARKATATLHVFVRSIQHNQGIWFPHTNAVVSVASLYPSTNNQLLHVSLSKHKIDPLLFSLAMHQEKPLTIQVQLTRLGCPLVGDIWNPIHVLSVIK